MPGINYILNSSKPFPEWILSHRVFKKINSIEKIWPAIGLPNFSQELEVFQGETAKNAAISLEGAISSLLHAKVANLKDTQRSSKEHTLNSKIRKIINVCSALYDAMVWKSGVICEQNKITLTVSSDIYSGNEDERIFKMGESLIKAVNKINVLLDDIKQPKIDYENNQSFKFFSQNNLPNKKFVMRFSSTGEDGAWDIATMSMRGINSCQSWQSIQSRGLIGSITSKYVAVVYIEGNTAFGQYGKEMRHRSVARLVFPNSVNKKPVIFLDVMYPSYNKDIFEGIKSIIEKRSGLKVLYSGAPELNNYCIMDEPVRAFLREGEYSYMDTPLGIKKSPTKTLNVKNKINYDNQKLNYINKISNSFKNKKETLLKDINISPNNKSIINLLKHCDKYSRATSRNPAEYMSGAILSTIGDPEEDFYSKKEYNRWLAKKIALNPTKLKEKTWDTIAKGSWMTSFPKATNRYFNQIFDDLKKDIVSSIEEN